MYDETISPRCPEIILSRSGTRQGDPLGAQYFALGLHPVLCLVASLLGTRGTLIAYCDDVHILCPPAVANEILSFSSLLPTARAGGVSRSRVLRAVCSWVAVEGEVLIAA